MWPLVVVSLIWAFAPGLIQTRLNRPDAARRLQLLGFGLMQASNLAFAAGQVFYQRLRAKHHALRDREVFGFLYLGAAALAAVVMVVRHDDVTLHGPQLLTLGYLG